MTEYYSDKICLYAPGDYTKSSKVSVSSVLVTEEISLPKVTNVMGAWSITRKNPDGSVASTIPDLVDKILENATKTVSLENAIGDPASLETVKTFVNDVDTEELKTIIEEFSSLKLAHEELSAKFAALTGQ